MMIVVQEMCARIGLITGKGLAGVIKSKYPKKILYPVASLLIIANTINIGADIGAMELAVSIDISNITNHGYVPFHSQS